MLNFFKNKNVFITGHTGFKGAWLSEILIHANANVKGFALKPEKESLFNLLNLSSRMDSVYGDIRDEKLLKKEMHAFKPEIVLHLAAQPIVRESYKNPVDTYQINVMGTVNVLEACRELSSLKSFVNITTDKVYENNEWCYGYREVDSLNGYDPYSNSKSCSELVTSSYTKSFFSNTNVSISTARSGNVIGGGDYSKERIIPDCIKASKNNEVIVIRNPQSVRPYQHVLDCLNGYLVLAKSQYERKETAGCYNFGPENCDCVSTGTLVELFCKHYDGAKYEIRMEVNAPHEAGFLKLDCSKAKSVLKWFPKLGIEQAVQLTVNFAKGATDESSARQILKTQVLSFFGE